MSRKVSAHDLARRRHASGGDPYQLLPESARADLQQVVDRGMARLYPPDWDAARRDFARRWILGVEVPRVPIDHIFARSA